MGNHEIPCDYCGHDTRGLSGVKGCDTHTEAKKCYLYNEKVAENYVKHQQWWHQKFRGVDYVDK